MNRSLYLLAVAVGIAACSAAPVVVGPPPAFERVAEIPSPDGDNVAYFARGELYQDAQPEALLAELHAAGVSPDAAWFSPYKSNSCPGAEMYLTVVVPGGIVVRVPEGTGSNRLRRLGYYPADGPLVIQDSECDTVIRLARQSVRAG